MLPMIRRNSDNWLPDIFNDFFDNSWMERPTYTAPAINVIEARNKADISAASSPMRNSSRRCFFRTMLTLKRLKPRWRKAS